MGVVDVHALPDDTLLLIFEQFCCSSQCKFDAWKPELTLLSICRRWRTLAFSLVYRRVYVRYGNGKKKTGQFKGSHGTFSDDSVNIELVTNSVLSTNENIVAPVQCIQFEINYMLHPLTGLEACLATLQKTVPQWPSVCKLRILFENYGEAEMETDNLSMYSEYILQHISAVVQLVCKVMPNLVALNFESFTDTDVELSLCKSLSAAYSEYVTKLISSRSLTMPHDCLFEKLTYMDIALDCSITNAGQHASFLSKSLIYLNLRNVSPWFNWSIFTDGSNSSETKFINLQRLGLNFFPSAFITEAGKRQIKNNRFEICFPNLTHLNIKSYMGCQPMFEFIVFPDKISFLQINSDANFFCSTNHINLPRANKMLFYISDDDSDVSGNIFEDIEQIALKTTSDQHFEISVYRADTLNLISNIDYCGITILNVHSTISSKKLVEIIIHLPELIGLSCFDLTITREETQQYTTLCDPSNLDAVKPLNKSLKRFILEWNQDEESSPELVILLKYLLPRLPALKELMATGCPHTLMLTAIEELVPRYPHVQVIDLS